MSPELILGLVIIVADMIVISRTLSSKTASVGAKIQWVFLACLLPLLGAVLWLIWGPKQ